MRFRLSKMKRFKKMSKFVNKRNVKYVLHKKENLLQFLVDILFIVKIVKNWFFKD